MISQKHEDEMQQGEPLLSPIEEKQTTTPSEVQSQQTRVSPPRWRGVLLSILGCVLPFAGAFLIGWPWWHTYEVETNAFYMNMLFGGVFLSVFVGAILLRSWWALLIVPVACAAGWILAYYILWPLLYGWEGYGPSGPGWSAVQAEFESGRPWYELGIIIPLASPLVMVCTLLGVMVSKWLKKRRQRPLPEHVA